MFTVAWDWWPFTRHKMCHEISFRKFSLVNKGVLQCQTHSICIWKSIDVIPQVPLCILVPLKVGLCCFKFIYWFFDISRFKPPFCFSWPISACLGSACQAKVTPSRWQRLSAEPRSTCHQALWYKNALILTCTTLRKTRFFSLRNI